MNIIGFNRVQLIVPQEQIEAAVDRFNALLGTHLPRPHPIEGHPGAQPAHARGLPPRCNWAWRRPIARAGHGSSRARGAMRIM
jgi:hypothetical protein